MPNRRSGFQKKIETVHWTYGSFTFLNQAAGVVAVQGFPAQHLPETIMRARGSFTAYLDGLQPASGINIGVGLGLILVPEGTGTTVLWSPITDGDAPWFYVDYFNLAYDEQVVDAVATNTQAALREIDSKAMRRVRNQEVQVVLEQASVEGTSAINVTGQVRILSGS